MIKRPIDQRDYQISEGDAGIYETVNYMWHYALRDTKEPQIIELVRTLRGKNNHDTIKNIYDGVGQNVKYQLDPPDMELITAPIHFVNGNVKAGDCDCMTTLLVCLLETAGFECGITVIAWRLDEYTHVFCEVKYDGTGLILDPTLKRNGFGKQDKQIKRKRRITKQEMQKLRVLADGENETSPKYKRVPHNNKKNCCPKEQNQNHNNINVNFGTNVEHSHNPVSSSHNMGRAVESGFLPAVQPSYRAYQQPQVLPVPVVSPPVISRPAIPISLPPVVVERDIHPPVQSIDFPVKQSDVSRQLIGNMIGQLPPSSDKIYVVSGKRPTNVVVTKRKSSGYVEFP